MTTDGGLPPKTERQIWDDLVTELDYERFIFERSTHRLGEILYRLKCHLRDYGLDQVRTGRWQSLLRERQIEKNTARDWIVAYQIKECVPRNKCFFPKEMERIVAKKAAAHQKKSQQNRENNSTGTVPFDQNELAKLARVEFADDRDANNRDINGRTVVECCFVLTQDEKLDFLKALNTMSELEATRLMFEAVVKAMPKGELHEEGKAASV